MNENFNSEIQIDLFSTSFILLIRRAKKMVQIKRDFLKSWLIFGIFVIQKMEIKIPLNFGVSNAFCFNW